MTEMEDVLTKIANAIRTKRCVIFFGSGISADSGLPTGHKLMRELLEDPELGEAGLAIAAQVMRHRKGPVWLHRRLREIFLMGNRQPNELHKILAFLNSKYYITTNYDLLFDMVLKDFLNLRDLPIVVKDADIPHADPVTYVKLHGDIAVPETVVLTYDDYDTRFENNPNLLHLLYSLFAQNLVLFVGYSLSDLNVLSVVRKIGRGDPNYARGMYILVTNPDKGKVDFFQSLNVQIVTVARHNGEPEGEALQRFLLRLWNRTLDFDSYLNPQPRELSYTSKLEIAISFYYRGDYAAADQLFEGLDPESEKIWRADPGAFAQYAYFKLKTLDKLNHWEQMKNAGQQLFKMLENLSTLYPKPVCQLIRSQIHASLGLPLLRASFFREAQSHLVEALALDPDDSVIGRDALLLHADRHTVLACIELGLFYFGEHRNPECLQRSESNLNCAMKLFKAYDDPEGPSETHFMGRYFGACAFLRIAKLWQGLLKFDDRMSDELCKYGWMSYREVNPGSNRVPYGKLAGLYCEASVFLHLAGEHRKQSDQAAAEVCYDRAIDILEALLAGNAEAVQIRLSPLEKCKFHRALEIALRGRARLGSPELIERVEAHHRLYREFMDSEELRFMDHRVLTDESWVLTPLN